MLVKNFEGITMKDAMKKVKKEFGASAVILSTAEKAIEGSQAKMVEVRAAIADGSKIEGAKFDSSYDYRSGEFDGIEAKLAQMELKIQKIAEGVITKDRLQNFEYLLKEIKLLTLDSLKNAPLSALKNLPQPMVDIYQKLQLTGIDRTYLQELLTHLKAIPKWEAQGNAFESVQSYFEAHTLRWLMKRIIIAPQMQILKGSTLLQEFVGPTGSGKTTTIAKIAAYYKKQEKANILILSYDNLRIAASEELRVYAKILDIPFMILNKPSQIEEILSKNKDKDLILLDTAGRCPKNEKQIADLKSFSGFSVPVDVHLVLSLTEKPMQLEQAVSGFAPLGIKSLIFTKLDESLTYGEIFNLSHKWRVPLSFFASGQQVPEDFEKATRERVLEKIFRL